MVDLTHRFQFHRQDECDLYRSYLFVRSPCTSDYRRLSLQTLSGSILVILLGSLLLAPGYRRHAIALFLLGALSHHALDLALLNASGYSYAVFWPITEYYPPSGDLYRSSDPWPALVTAAGAVGDGIATVGGMTTRMPSSRMPFVSCCVVDRSFDSPWPSRSTGRGT